MGESLWDARRHEAYVRQRDEANERRVDRREGISVAREIDAMWAALPADERKVLRYLLLCGADSCIGRSSDPLLSRLADRGILSRPPGVRAVLADDLVTSFLVAPAIWAALDARRGEFLAPESEQPRLLEDARKSYEGRLTPIVSAGSAAALASDT